MGDGRWEMGDGRSEMGERSGRWAKVGDRPFDKLTAGRRWAGLRRVQSSRSEAGVLPGMSPRPGGPSPNCGQECPGPGYKGGQKCPRPGRSSPNCGQECPRPGGPFLPPGFASRQCFAPSLPVCSGVRVPRGPHLRFMLAKNRVKFEMKFAGDEGKCEWQRGDRGGGGDGGDADIVGVRPSPVLWRVR